MRVVVLFFILLSLGIAAVAQPVSFRDVLELEVPEPDRVIRYGEASPQFIELYVPAESSASLLVFIHGGCWLNSFDVGHSRPLAHALRDEGYAVAALEFRRLDDEGGGWPGTFDDIQTALNTLHGKEGDVFDTSSVTLIGHSAGGHLALLAASPIMQRQNETLPIRAVIGLAAITDIEMYAQGESGCENAAARFIASDPDARNTMNPSLHPIHPQTILLQGTEDTIVLREQTELTGAEVVMLEGLGHFDVIHPETDAFPELIRVLQSVH